MLNDKSISCCFCDWSLFWANIEVQSFVGGRYFDILFGINYKNQEGKGVWEKK